MRELGDISHLETRIPIVKTKMISGTATVPATTPERSSNAVFGRIFEGHVLIAKWRLEGGLGTGPSAWAPAINQALDEQAVVMFCPRQQHLSGLLTIKVLLHAARSRSGASRAEADRFASIATGALKRTSADQYDGRAARSMLLPVVGPHPCTLARTRAGHVLHPGPAGKRPLGEPRARAPAVPEVC